MKNIFYMPVLVTIFTVLVSCGSSNSDHDGSSEVLKEETNVDPDAKGGNTCLLSYQEKLGELLTGEMASSVTGLSVEKMETKLNNILKNPEYHSIEYKWKTDRTEERIVGNMTMNWPVVYFVKLQDINDRSLKEFKASYKKATKEQVEQAKKAIDEGFDRKSGNEKVNKQIDKLDELGVDKKTQKSTSSSIGSVIGEIAQAYSDVEGVGDAASWNSVEKRLYVLEKGVQFSISIRMSDDDEVNKAQAIQLAKEIIAKCG
jgi:hypothetical protein